MVIVRPCDLYMYTSINPIPGKRDLQMCFDMYADICGSFVVPKLYTCCLLICFARVFMKYPLAVLDNLCDTKILSDIWLFLYACIALWFWPSNFKALCIILLNYNWITLYFNKCSILEMINVRLIIVHFIKI